LGEGFGVEWPLSDAFLLMLAAIYLGAACLLFAWLKQVKKQQRAKAPMENRPVDAAEQTEEVTR